MPASRPTAWMRMVRVRTHADWVLLVLLNAIAFAILGWPLLTQGRIYHDNIRLFSVFRDSLHAANVYGELMLWHPEYTTFGFPAYYYAHLATNTFTPLATIVLAGAWLARMVGVRIEDVTSLYIVYVYLVVPLLLSVSFYTLARQIVHHPLARRYLIVVSAFSPGVIFNYSDNGPEQSVYGFFAAAAFLAFYRQPDVRRFLVLVAAFGAVAAALNHIGLYWNVIFVPLFVLMIVCVGFSRAALSRAWHAVPWPAWAALALLLASYLAWPATTFADGSTILRRTLETRIYDASNLLAGNAFEVMTSSTPGVGFEWIPPNSPSRVWTMVRYPRETFAYGYLGALTLALACVGIVWGRDPWRIRIAILVIVGCVILPMAAANPLFTAFVDLTYFLRSVNHFSDTAFRNGGSFMLLLAAGLGLEAIARPHRRRHALVALMAIFVMNGVGGFLLLRWLYSDELIVAIVPLLTFFTIIATVYLVAIGDALGSGMSARRFLMTTAIVALIDVSVVTAFHCSAVVWPLAQGPFPRVPRQALSFAQGDERRRYADDLLTLADQAEMRRGGVGTNQLRGLPQLALYDAITETAPPDLEREIDRAHREAIQGMRLSYNTAVIDVAADREMSLFWRNSYFPGWTAVLRTNGDREGREVFLSRAFGAFMSVRVPAGRSEVAFRFEPPWFRTLFWWTYGSLALLTCITLASLLRK